jgi:hypothetical protein
MSPRRIVVGLEAAPRGWAALRAAAEIAARTETELLALFVEDVNLLRLAGLPFACEVGFPSAVTRAIDTVAMERALRGLAQTAERTLAALARGTPLRWSYRVARGALMSELLATAAETDLVVACAAQGWTPRRLAARARASVLLVEDLFRPGAPVVAACSSALPPAQAARLLLESIAVLGQDHEVTLALLCETAAAAEHWARAVRQQAPAMRLHVIPVRDEAELHARLAALHRPFIVLPEPMPAAGSPQARGSPGTFATAGAPRTRRRRAP